MKLLKLNSNTCLEIFSANTETELSLPFIEKGISAGFPSPADDFLDTSIDLNKALITNPNTTFIARVKGNSLQDADIENGDLVVIDRSLEPTNGRIAICAIDGEFTAKFIKIEKDCCYLIAANENFKPIKVTAENEFLIWGIVTNVIKKV